LESRLFACACIMTFYVLCPPYSSFEFFALLIFLPGLITQIYPSALVPRPSGYSFMRNQWQNTA
jgi:hypothetical protein